MRNTICSLNSLFQLVLILLLLCSIVVAVVVIGSMAAISEAPRQKVRFRHDYSMHMPHVP